VRQQWFRVRRVRKNQSRPVYFNIEGRWSNAANAQAYARKASAAKVAGVARRAYPNDSVELEAFERPD
jgi:2-methylisocitrate lyase-like PEP mutase family enzyme